ncbi:TonB C-terminal domain-containing protein [Sulfuricurvum sp.]|uniref:TonB C-terminal domain-containing protein n=1 Tax=Sulfuricurvum sp. TaxID=2025608 RepID=UPI002605EF48|nr:TonB C-terminal domain-containing protein [Sulfuricurvum sp.]MDD2780114.1 TonB C-terminal domain-containing protein [Sulfuricurvum sp.]
MGSNQERYFFLSGLISFTLFITLVVLVGYSIVLTPKIEQFSMIQSDVINVSIALTDAKSTEQNEPESLTSPAEPVVEEKPKEVEKPEPLTEISDLFAQVKQDKIPKKKIEDTAQRDELNALEKEVLERRDTPRFSDKVNKLALVKPAVKMVSQGGSTGPLVNEYHAKIQALVHTYFRPPSGSAGEIARVRMSISASGKLIAYRVISYSGNGSFNNEVDWLKDRLSSIRFPEHPDGKDALLEFILTAKE